jgi:hypothetical protein
MAEAIRWGNRQTVGRDLFFFTLAINTQITAHSKTNSSPPRPQAHLRPALLLMYVAVWLTGRPV